MAETPKGLRSRLAFLLLGFVLIFGGLAIRVADPVPVQALRNTYFDYLQRLSPRPFAELPVRVVDIDERSLTSIGQWPWPRDTIAELTRRLLDMGAASVAFDVLFAEPDRYSPAVLAQKTPGLFADSRAADVSYDQILADTISGQPVTLGVAARLEGDDGLRQGKAGVVEIGETPSGGFYRMRTTTPLAPPLDAAATGIAGINVAPGDSGGVVRQVPLMWQAPDGPLPSLSLEALRLALGETTFVVEGFADLPDVTAGIGVGGYTVPTTAEGALWLRYRKDDPRLYVSAADILADDPSPVADRIDGNIVLVGASAAGLYDIRRTALGESVPGVSIHAQVIEQVLLGLTLSRSDYTAGLELIAFISLGLVVTGVMSMAGPVPSIASGTVAGVVILLASWFSFHNAGHLFDATFPLLGGVINFGILAGYQFVVADRDKRMIRRSFSHYVAPEVLGQIERSNHQLELGGEIRDATVMFCDIRNFTPLSEAVPAQELVTILNALFTDLGAEILDERGTIDKFIGDSIMAFWNAPLEIADHPYHAAKAALRMRLALTRFHDSDLMQGRPPLALAMGLATGPVCVGNIGSSQRFNYTVIGDTVNVAARIETACRHVGYDVVIADTLNTKGLAVLDAGSVGVKGKSSRVGMRIVVGDETIAASDEFTDLTRLHDGLIERLGAGEPTAFLEPTVQEVLSAAVRVDRGLVEFYGRILDRPSDFAP